MSMLISYSLTQGENGSEFSAVFDDGSVKTISDTHPNFKEIVNLVLTNEDDWEELVFDLMNITKSLNRRFQDLTERVSTDGASIYFDGDVIDSSLSRYIIKLLKESHDPDAVNTDSDTTWEALVKFLELIYANPNPNSRESLYEFIRSHGLTIRKDGHFIAYKGLTHDLTSIHAGYGIVDGVEMNGNLPNKPGSVVRFPRADVDDNTGVGCSMGLHAGTLNYASGFGNRVVAVAVNPMHVVSVPNDHEFQKIRTCEYEVLLEIDVPKENRATKGEESDTFWRPLSTELYSDMGSAIVEGDLINFDYVNKDNEESYVENAYVDSVETDRIVAIIQEGGYRTYLIDSMSSVELLDEESDDFDDYGDELDDVIEDPLDKDTPPESVISFTYTKKDTPSVVSNFTVMEVTEDKVHGILTNEEWRSYFIENMSEVQVISVSEPNKQSAEELQKKITDIGVDVLNFIKNNT